MVIPTEQLENGENCMTPDSMLTTQEMIDEDPELLAEDLAQLRLQVLRRYGQRLDLGDVA